MRICAACGLAEVESEVDALRVRVTGLKAENTTLRARVAELERADKGTQKLVARLSGLLSRTVNTIRGEPANGLHSFHDVPERAAALIARVAEVERVRDAAVANTMRIEHELRTILDGWGDVTTLLARVRAVVARLAEVEDALTPALVAIEGYKLALAEVEAERDEARLDAQGRQDVMQYERDKLRAVVADLRQSREREAGMRAALAAVRGELRHCHRLLEVHGYHANGGGVIARGAAALIAADAALAPAPATEGEKEPCDSCGGDNDGTDCGDCCPTIVCRPCSEAAGSHAAVEHTPPECPSDKSAPATEGNYQVGLNSSPASAPAPGGERECRTCDGAGEVERGAPGPALPPEPMRCSDCDGTGEAQP